MKPNTRLESETPDNASLFSDPFFKRFSLRPGPRLALSEDVSKTYQFPTFYGDVTCAIAIFLCDFQRAKEVLPHPSMQPVKMPGGRSVVIFSCYEYKNVMHLGPYNEIAMTIPIMVDARFSPPIAPLVMDFKKKGYFVFSMPVTSLENQIRGTEIWGLPKVAEEIDIVADESHCRTQAKNEEGDVTFDLSVPKAGSPRQFDESGFLYTMHEGKLLKSRTCFKGDFSVTTNLSLLWSAPDPADEEPALKIGSGPRGDLLRNLKIDQRAFQFRYAEAMNSCFDLPEEQ